MHVTDTSRIGVLFLFELDHLLRFKAERNCPRAELRVTQRGSRLNIAAEIIIALVDLTLSLRIRAYADVACAHSVIATDGRERRREVSTCIKVALPQSSCTNVPKEKPSLIDSSEVLPIKMRCSECIHIYNLRGGEKTQEEGGKGYLAAVHDIVLTTWVILPCTMNAPRSCYNNICRRSNIVPTCAEEKRRRKRGVKVI